MICVFVPTNRYGGLDVLEASLERQTLKPDLLIIADELYDLRSNFLEAIGEDLNIKTHAFKPQQPVRNAARNLVAAYNQGAEIAIEQGFGEKDLFLSLQDYIWLMPNAIERMLLVHEARPDDLITGVTHISLDPFPTQVVDHNGLYSIFEEPYTDRPRRMMWKDVRVEEIYTMYPNNHIISVEPGHWEANWAGLPFKYLSYGERWSEIYDTGYAYENMDFAQRIVEDYHCDVLMDTANIAISLPHKAYWKNEEEDLKKHNNRNLYEKMWG